MGSARKKVGGGNEQPVTARVKSHLCDRSLRKANKLDKANSFSFFQSSLSHFLELKPNRYMSPNLKHSWSSRRGAVVNKSD